MKSRAIRRALIVSKKVIWSAFSEARLLTVKIENGAGERTNRGCQPVVTDPQPRPYGWKSSANEIAEVAKTGQSRTI